MDALLARTRAGHHGTWDGLHLLRRTGSPLPVFLSAGPIEYANQQLAQIVYVDLSERTRLENQLVQSEKMAAFGQLGAGIAHEVKNPLAGILGCAQVAVRKAEPGSIQYTNSRSSTLVTRTHLSMAVND